MKVRITVNCDFGDDDITEPMLDHLADELSHAAFYWNEQRGQFTSNYVITEVDKSKMN